MQGNPINIEINKENDVFCFIVFLSFLALAAAIAGTNAVENATFIESGKLVKVSTFPPNIPYWLTASSAGKNSFKLLTTVNESMFLFTDDNIAVNAIGNETSLNDLKLVVSENILNNKKIEESERKLKRSLQNIEIELLKRIIKI